MEQIKESGTIIQLIHPILVLNGEKWETWDRLIFSNIKKFLEGDKMLKIISKTGKEWWFPYTNIKSIEYKEYVK